MAKAHAPEPEVREIIIPEASAQRIRAKQAAEDLARREKLETVQTVLEALGCDIRPRGDGQMWNVMDAPDGGIIATFGPRIVQLPVPTPREAEPSSAP